MENNEMTVNPRLLFERVDTLQQESNALQRQLDAKKGELSEAISEIYNSLGKGPFEYKGKVVTIRKRGETYFFVEGKSEVTKID